MKRKRFGKKFYIGTFIIAFLLLCAAVGSLYTPYDPEAMDAAMKLKGCSLTHPLGTDQFGRDIFSRVLTGLRTTFLIAIGTNAIGAVLGTMIGALTGYFGGLPDEILMRFNDAVLSFPSILMSLMSLMSGSVFSGSSSAL